MKDHNKIIRAEKTWKLKIDFFDLQYLPLGIYWIVLVMGIPQGYTAIKTTLTFLLCLLSAYEIIVKRVMIWKSYVVKLTGFILYYMISLIYGTVLMGYEFAPSLIRPYAVMPICAFVMGYIFIYKNRIDFIHNGLIIFGFFISMIDVMVVLNTRGVFPSLPFFRYFRILSIEASSNKLAMRMTNEHVLMFVIPYMVCMLLYKRKRNVIKFLNYVGVIMGLVYTILSGRKALILVVGCSVLVTFILLLKGQSLKKKVFSIVAGLMGLTILFVAISRISGAIHIENIFSTMWNGLTGGLSSNAGGISKRLGNIKDLTMGWLNNPLTFFIGNGLNSYVAESLASTTTKWSYEVYYNALLYQTGIFGIGLLVATVCFFVKPIYRMYKLTRDITYMALLVGTGSFLFCAATNPMLTDSLWFWTILWAERIWIDKFNLEKSLEQKGE